MDDQRTNREGGDSVLGKAIFAFMLGGCFVTFSALAFAFLVTGGKIAMGVYDVMALPLFFLPGGAAGIGIMFWLRKHSKK